MMDKNEFRRQAMALHPDRGGSHEAFVEFMRQAKGPQTPDNVSQVAVAEMFAYLQSTVLENVIYTDLPKIVAQRLRARADKAQRDVDRLSSVSSTFEGLASRFDEPCLMQEALLLEAKKAKASAENLKSQVDELHRAVEYTETVGFSPQQMSGQSSGWTTYCSY